MLDVVSWFTQDFFFFLKGVLFLQISGRGWLTGTYNVTRSACHSDRVYVICAMAAMFVLGALRRDARNYVTLQHGFQLFASAAVT